MLENLNFLFLGATGCCIISVNPHQRNIAGDWACGAAFALTLPRASARQGRCLGSNSGRRRRTRGHVWLTQKLMAGTKGTCPDELP